MKKNFHTEKMVFVLNNVFLTRRLPLIADKTDFDGALVRFTFKCLRNWETPIPSMKLIKNTLQTWKNVQCDAVNESRILNALQGLQPGETFAIFLRAQNSVITIRRSKSDLDNALMSVSRTSASNETVMNADDLFTTFPERAVWIPFHRFLSKTFACQVATLCNNMFDKTLKETSKAGINHADSRDVAEPFLVMSWLLGAMSGTKEAVYDSDRVQKVIRDDVLSSKHSGSPWRRSGEWIAIKSVLQIILINELGTSEGTVVYKSLMIYIMVRFLKRFSNATNEQDILMQMMSKISRRMAKLKKLINKFKESSISIDCSLPNLTIQWVSSVLQNSCNVLQRHSKIAENQWKDYSKACGESVQINISVPNAYNHLIHNLSQTATNRLSQAFEEVKEPPSSYVPIPSCVTRSEQVTALFDIKFLEASGRDNQIEENIWDFELWVRNVLWQNFSLNVSQFIRDSDKLFNLLKKYLDLSFPFYLNDPLGSSRMVLTAYMILAALDSIAIKEWPIMSQYQSSFDENIFGGLLIPRLDDMKYVLAVQTYFTTRNKSATYPCIISKLCENSVGPRIAADDKDMQQKRNEILMHTLKQRQLKIKEFQREKERYDEIMEEYDGESHTIGYNGRCYKCFKCKLLQRAKSMRIDVYEDPIPVNCIWEQNMIVFELSIPTAIRCFRDALFLIQHKLSRNQFQPKRMAQKWTDHPQLGKWVSRESYSSLVYLGSIAELFSNTRFKGERVANIIDSNTCLKPCGLTIGLFYETLFQNFINVKCQNGAQNILHTMKACNEPYNIDETWISGTTHTENEVLAFQAKCPEHLDINEFKAFGSLRAGHRLQLRNLLRAFEMCSLSFERSSVFALVAQTLWQVGPAVQEFSDDPVLYFESHCDLLNDGFCFKLIECLLKFLKNICKNWKKHSQLQVVIIIALRLYSLSTEQIRSKAEELLMRCRNVAEKWAEKIENLLSGKMSSTVEDIQQIRLKLVDVAAFAALTFDIDESHGHLIINKDTLVSWLLAVARIHDNILLNDSLICIIDIERINMLRRVKLIGLRFEKLAIQTLVSNSDEIFAKFLSLRWSDFHTGNCKNNWTPHLQPARQWYHNVFEVSANRTVKLQVNILSGKFLVNGNPIGRLPESISLSPDYVRVFRTCNFEVQPAAERPGTFVTLHKLQGSKFIFSLRAHGLVAVERRQEGDEYELIPSRFFEGDFPDHFVSSYSHWLCKQTRVLYFRPVKVDDYGFFKSDSSQHFPYQFDLQKKTLLDVQRKRYLVNIRSNTFDSIYDFGGMSRLEFKKFVHLWLHIKVINAQLQITQHRLNVELPRLGLSFKEKAGKLFSREHEGMVVADHQGDFGTLIGLKNGLLLCEEDREFNNNCLRQRVLLLPYAKKIELTESRNSCGQSVSINFDELLSPPCFAYHLDEWLCELRGPANQEAWLYLALLHAMTSSSLPDHFTGLTGTESSMRLLQIGRTFSCRPSTRNAIYILKRISKLAPIRTFYPPHLKHMQNVTWLPNLQSTYGYEGLALAAKLLLNDAENYEDLFSQNIQENLKKENKNGVCKILNERAYWRYKSQLNPSARLNEDSEQKFGGSPPRKKAWAYNYDDNKPEVKKSRFLMETYYQSKGLHTSTNLWLIIQEKGQLKQSDNISFSSLLTWGEISILDNYLKFYELAQNVIEESFCPFQYSLLLSFLAFKGENVDLLFSLLAVVIMRINVKPPTVRNYDHLRETEFDLKAIRSVIKEEIKTLYLYSSQFSITNSDKNIVEMYENSTRKAIELFEGQAEKQWMLRRFELFDDSFKSFDDVVNIRSLEEKINSLFIRWDNNEKLKLFFTEMEIKIREWQPSLPFPITTLSQMDASVPSFVNNSYAFRTSSKTSDLYFVIENLSDNPEVKNIFRKQSSVNCDKVISNSNQKNQSTPLASLYRDQVKSDDALIQYMYKSLLKSSEAFCKHKELGPVERHFKDADLTEEWKSIINTNTSKLRLWWKEVLNAMKPQNGDVVGHALVAGGLWRRLCPVVIIPCILPLTACSRAWLAIDKKNAIPKNVVDRVGAVIVGWTAEQRALRILKLLRDESSPEILSREIINEGHTNWIPSEHPEWLILELEGNFLIRPLQVDIARSMLNAKENFVQQLNMGEGKTSVIVPLLAVSLSNSDQLVRVTILRSLLYTNYEALVDKLGGLLNRRVYIVPCRRDMKLNASKILGIHQECMAGQGLMLTTPEYRLSLDLKTLEHCRKGDDDGIQLYELRCWLREHARDILDEADEILNVKYQVVYTIGDQLLVDGGEQRWKIAQAVLRLVNRFAVDLFNIYGNENIYFKAESSHGDDAFSNIRFLSSNLDMYETLCGKIVDSVLEKQVPEVSIATKLDENDKKYVRLFILSNNIMENEELIARLNEVFKENLLLKEELLILRGILCFEVLHIALQKRWRVNFGINPISKTTQMAVPFRAKDVAAEKTEFGHPDVAIILTQICYYMSGLNEAQMDDVFKRLDNCSYKHAEYERWISAVGKVNVPKDLHLLNGVNLDDIEQREQLYSLLRYSMNVVNFWLSRAVFPKESKQFPHKISMSAWDLCLSKNRFGSGAEKPTTGFSGTNESQLLLPLTIKQKDLPKILGTNAMVLSYLLQSENNSYYHFGPCADALDEDILNKAVEKGARVLLDVGALMLQMDNEKVAQEWLRKLSENKQVSAAVFFGKDDRLMVCDRDGRQCLFSVSPYCHQLDRCVVYLDDIHTRGTDLRFPYNTLGCVTLGKGLTKDRLVQACMRMRLLGKGHSIYYCAANDVHLSITKQMKSNEREPQSADILRWVIENSCDSVRDGLLHWSSQGLHRSIKDAAESAFNYKDRNIKSELKKLGVRCTEDEVIQLFRLYGGSRLLESLPEILKKSLHSSVKRFVEHFDNNLYTARNFSEAVKSIGNNIFSRCNEYVNTYKRFANILDEEQERELEVELEEERHVCRPNLQIPHKPTCSQAIIELVTTGCFNNTGLVDIVPVNKIFDSTRRLSKFFVGDCWNPGLLVTKEFTMVVKDSYTNVEDFLFEISWLVVVDHEPSFNGRLHIIISSFEANELLPIFRSAEQNRGVRLHMFAPRLRNFQNYFINERALVIPDFIPPGVDDLLIAQLTVLSGGLFFNSEIDQDAYCKFLGCVSDTGETNGLQNPSIDKMDDFPPKKRQKLDISHISGDSQDCKRKMAIEILRARGRCLQSTSSHICLLLFHDIREL